MMKPPVKPVVEGFKLAQAQTGYVAAMDCPVKQGENTVHQEFGTDAQGRLVVLCSNGKVRTIDPNEPHVLVPDPSQFDLAQWQATQRLDQEDLAAKKELDAQAGFLFDWLRKDWAIRIARDLHGIKDHVWDTQQKAAKELVESGEACFLRQDKESAHIALGQPYLDFEPVPVAPVQVIWWPGRRWEPEPQGSSDGSRETQLCTGSPAGTWKWPWWKAASGPSRCRGTPTSGSLSGWPSRPTWRGESNSRARRRPCAGGLPPRSRSAPRTTQSACCWTPWSARASWSALTATTS